MYKIRYFKDSYDLVNFLNEKNIMKENIIKIIKRDSEYTYRVAFIYWE